MAKNKTLCGYGKYVPIPLPAKATPVEIATVKKYVRLLFVKGLPDPYSLWLVVGVQQFQLITAYDTPGEAAFVAWMLGKALLGINVEIAPAAKKSARNSGPKKAGGRISAPR